MEHVQNAILAMSSLLVLVFSQSKFFQFNLNQELDPLQLQAVLNIPMESVLNVLSDIINQMVHVLLSVINVKPGVRSGVHAFNVTLDMKFKDVIVF
jgi:hypothetical protein